MSRATSIPTANGGTVVLATATGGGARLVAYREHSGPGLPTTSAMLHLTLDELAALRDAATAILDGARGLAA